MQSSQVTATNSLQQLPPCAVQASLSSRSLAAWHRFILDTYLATSRERYNTMHMLESISFEI